MSQEESQKCTVVLQQQPDPELQLEVNYRPAHASMPEQHPAVINITPVKIGEVREGANWGDPAVVIGKRWTTFIHKLQESGLAVKSIKPLFRNIDTHTLILEPNKAAIIVLAPKADETPSAVIARIEAIAAETRQMDLETLGKYTAHFDTKAYTAPKFDWTPIAGLSRT